MKIFGIVLLVAWCISFAFSMIVDNDKNFKIQYIITWIVLIIQLIDNYLID